MTNISASTGYGSGFFFLQVVNRFWWFLHHTFQPGVRSNARHFAPFDDRSAFHLVSVDGEVNRFGIANIAANSEKNTPHFNVW